MRKGVIAALQAAILLIVVWFVWRTLSTEIARFGSLDFDVRIRPGWVALAAVAVLGTYGLLIRAWTLVLAGWAERLPLTRAARIWCVANLGRYLPGKVWSVAGLAVLARQAGVSGWAAAASAVVMQFLALATGAAVFLIFVPGSVLAPTVPPEVVAAIGIGGALVAVIVTTTPVLQRVARLFKPEVTFAPLRPAAAGFGAAATVASWLSYGLALWLLSRGVVPEANLSIPVAIGAFAGAYIVGLVFIFAPGGVGVREGVLVTLLTPTMGGGAAVVLAVASRLLMTFTELVAALGAWWIAPPEPEHPE